MALRDDTPIGDVLDDADADGNDADDGASDGPAPAGSEVEVALDDRDLFVADASRSCENCSHRGVCAVYGNFRQEIAQGIPARTGGEPAFAPEDLAIICDYYEEEEAAEPPDN